MAMSRAMATFVDHSMLVELDELDHGNMHATSC